MNAGQPLDDGYPSINWPDPNPPFPLSKKCNANYDLVPFWVNPALVLFAVLVLTCLILLVLSSIQRAKASRTRKQNP